MNKIKLGNTALTVSPLCMGTVYLGSRVNDEDSFAFLDRFASLGGNFLDTARVYADWMGPEKQSSEKCIGRWLKARGLQNDVVVATKGGHPPLDGSGGPTLSAAELLQQAQESCRNLNMDVIPLYYLHRDDPALPVAQIMDALFLLQDRGLVRYLGCSNWRAERIRQANAYAAACGREGFAAVSNQWSLAQPVPGAGDPTIVHHDETLHRFHQETQLPLLPFTSMANGYLSKLAEGRQIAPGVLANFGLPANEAIARRAKALAAQKGMTIAQAAQCFFYAQDFPVIPVMSFSTIAQLEESAAATELRITPEEAAWLLHG